jgi:hypothetical protein
MWAFKARQAIAIMAGNVPSYPRRPSTFQNHSKKPLPLADRRSYSRVTTSGER